MSNPGVLEAYDPAALPAFDAVLDVRSPAEFAEDHLPGAINLPVLDDEERAEVGAIYVQQSAFLARKFGAALVARNIARHLETALAERSKDFRPLVYCWRGGQRSNAMATVLAQVGWRATVLRGGYRTYRRAVQSRLYEAPLGLRLVLLDGGTGTGKTAVLQALAARGVQALDLEALAEHRGSLLGAAPGARQPTQKAFESRLFAALHGFDPGRPVVAEAESSRIGGLFLPPTLWRAMAGAPRIELAAPRQARARHLASAYGDLTGDPAALGQTLERLTLRIARADRERLADLLEARDWPGLAEALIETHYDPAYLRSSRADARPLLQRIELAELSPGALAAAAARIEALLGSAP